MSDVGPGNATGDSLARLGRVGANGSLVGRNKADSPWTTVRGTALIRAFPPYHPDPHPPHPQQPPQTLPFSNHIPQALHPLTSNPNSPNTIATDRLPLAGARRGGPDRAEVMQWRG